MRNLVLAGALAAVAGCANSPSHDFYAACLDAGISEPECRMKAAEMRQNEPNRLSQLGQALTAASQAAQQNSPPAAQLPTRTHCYSRDTGFGQVALDCTTNP